MTYKQALKIADRAVRYLDEQDGNMSEAEALVHTAALDLANQKIRAYWGLNVPQELGQ